MDIVAGAAEGLLVEHLPADDAEVRGEDSFEVDFFLLGVQEGLVGYVDRFAVLVHREKTLALLRVEAVHAGRLPLALARALIRRRSMPGISTRVARVERSLAEHRVPYQVFCVALDRFQEHVDRFLPAQVRGPWAAVRDGGGRRASGLVLGRSGAELGGAVPAQLGGRERKLESLGVAGQGEGILILSQLGAGEAGAIRRRFGDLLLSDAASIVRRFSA